MMPGPESRPTEFSSLRGACSALANFAQCVFSKSGEKGYQHDEKILSPLFLVPPSRGF